MHTRALATLRMQTVKTQLQQGKQPNIGARHQKVSQVALSSRDWRQHVWDPASCDRQYILPHAHFNVMLILHIIRLIAYLHTE